MSVPGEGRKKRLLLGTETVSIPEPEERSNVVLHSRRVFLQPE